MKNESNTQLKRSLGPVSYTHLDVYKRQLHRLYCFFRHNTLLILDYYSYYTTICSFITQITDPRFLLCCLHPNDSDP